MRFRLIRRLKMTMWFGLLTLLFTQFQNCANVHSGATGTGDSTVHLIDSYNKAGIQFPESTVELFEEAQTVNLGGICNRSHDGDSFSWTVSSASGEVASGASTCSGGQFQFNVANVSPWNCGVSYNLSVDAAWGEKASMQVVKRCQPLASQDLSPANSGPIDCRLEYRLGEDGQGLCQASCYSQGILASVSNESLSQCSALQQKLSGQ